MKGSLLTSLNVRSILDHFSRLSRKASDRYRVSVVRKASLWDLHVLFAYRTDFNYNDDDRVRQVFYKTLSKALQHLAVTLCDHLLFAFVLRLSSS